MTLDQLKELKNRISAYNKAWFSRHVEAVQKYMSGDAWQVSAGWTGPLPDTTDKDSSRVIAMIARGFVSTNKIAEVCGRHTNSVVGYEPDWGLEYPPADTDLSEQEQAKRANTTTKVNNALTSWLEKRKVLSVIQKAVLNAVALERGVLRLYIPRSAMTRTEIQGGFRYQIPKESFERVLNRIYVSAPTPNQGGLLYNDDGVAEGAHFEFQRDGQAMLEWQFVDDAGKTVIVVEGQETEGRMPEASYPLEGELMMYQMERDSLVTPDMVTLQRALNKYLTMVSRNLDTAGFLSDTVLNGQMPGRWIPDATAPGGERFAPDEQAHAGAGIREYIAPVEVDDGKGGRMAIPASIDRREPVDASRTQPTKDDLLEAFYAEASQLHVLLNNDSSSTGEARIQATNEYRVSLAKTIPEVENAIRWMLRTLLLLGVHFSGEKDLAALAPNVRLNVYVTEPTSEEIKSDLEMVKAGTMSRESQMLRSRRITDAQKEQERIIKERTLMLDDPNARRDSITKAVEAGLYSQVQGLIEEGKTPEDAQRIVEERQSEQAALQTGV
jgi:hypothetical protein